MTAPGEDPGSLESLHDIALPDAVSWWPPASGWYVIGTLLLVVVGLVLWYALRRWRQNAYRRVARAKLVRLAREAEDASGRSDALRALPELLKRTALTVFPRQTVAFLSGAAWLRFLDRTGKTKDFTDGPGTVLPDLTYDPCSAARLGDADVRALFQTAARWINHHEMSAREAER